MDRHRSDHRTRRREADRPLGPEAARDGLTRRERVVLRLVAVRRSDREIAAALAISRKTVGVRVTQVLAKFDFPCRGTAIAYAQRHGLV